MLLGGLGNKKAFVRTPNLEGPGRPTTTSYPWHRRLPVRRSPNSVEPALARAPFFLANPLGSGCLMLQMVLHICFLKCFRRFCHHVLFVVLVLLIAFGLFFPVFGRQRKALGTSIGSADNFFGGGAVIISRSVTRLLGRRSQKNWRDN